jgi:hypothetical protein
LTLVPSHIIPQLMIYTAAATIWFLSFSRTAFG